MKHIGIKGIGTYVPFKIVTNHDLEKKMDTNDEWIRTRTGITQRHFAEGDENVVSMGVKAAQKALDSAGIKAEDLDMILVATATANHRFPSVANQIQRDLGIKGIPTMDLAAACAGFMYGVINAYHFISAGTYKHILVVGTEHLSQLINWEDRTTAVLFGDGAGAAVVSEVSEGKGILSFELGSDGNGGKHLYDNPHIVMNGREVFKFAVRQMPESSMNVIEKAGLQKEDVDFLVPHQANIRIIDAARERLGLPEERVSTTVSRYGNTSAASIPMAIDYELQQGKIKDGDTIVLVGFGGGLTWGAICLVWGK